MEKGYVRCGSSDIYYEIYGEGRPIVFLHGNGEDMGYFIHQKKELQKEYKVIFIDSRGHGKSSFGDEHLTLDLMSKDVMTVLEYLKIDKVDLVGFSDGGNIAIKIAINDSDILRTLVLVGANLKPKDLITSERIQIEEEVKEEIDDHKKAILKLMLDEPQIEDYELKKIKVPSLVIAGENDLIEEECTKRINKNIEDSRLEIIKDADHFLIDKEWEKFNNMLRRFINRF